MTGGHHLTVRTPSAVAAVKGTEFCVEADPSGCALAVYKGSVDVSGPDQKDTVTVKAAQETIVPFKAKPVRPRALGKRWSKQRTRMNEVRQKALDLRNLSRSGKIKEWREMRRLMFLEGKGSLAGKDKKNLEQLRRSQPHLWNSAQDRIKKYFQKKQPWKQRQKTDKMDRGRPDRDHTPVPETRIPPRKHPKR
jgi:hypothetical protein